MTSNTRNTAEAQFAKLRRVEDARNAMSQYRQEQAAIDEKTARLRAARLAREAEAGPTAGHQEQKKDAARPAAKPRRKTAAAR